MSAPEIINNWSETRLLVPFEGIHNLYLVQIHEKTV